MRDLCHADKSEAIKVRNKDGDEVIGEDGTPCVVSISTRFSPHADKAAIALTKSIYEPDAVSVLPWPISFIRIRCSECHYAGWKDS